MATAGFVLLLSAAFLFCPGQSKKNCSTNWAEFQGECIYFAKTPTSWTRALVQCKQLGGYLLTDDNADKHDFVSNIASAMYGFGLENFWIGASDEIIEGSWRWLETGLPISNYNKWAPGQPSSNMTLNCVYMAWDAGNLLWKESLCEPAHGHHPHTRTYPGNYYYICEKPVGGITG